MAQLVEQDWDEVLLELGAEEFFAARGGVFELAAAATKNALGIGKSKAGSQQEGRGS